MPVFDAYWLKPTGAATQRYTDDKFFLNNFNLCITVGEQANLNTMLFMIQSLIQTPIGGPFNKNIKKKLSFKLRIDSLD